MPPPAIADILPALARTCGYGRSLGWRIPNRPEATRSNVDRYLISLRELEDLTGETFPVDDFRKDEVPASSWVLPIGCDKG